MYFLYFQSYKSIEPISLVNNHFLFVFNSDHSIDNEDEFVITVPNEGQKEFIRQKFGSVIKAMFNDMVRHVKYVNECLYESVEYLPEKYDTVIKLPGKRNASRAKKILADYGLLFGFYEDSINIYRSIIESCKKNTDYLFLGGIYEGLAAINYHSNHITDVVNNLNDALKYYIKINVNSIYISVLLI